MSDQAMITLGVVFGILATIVIPFLVASPRLRKRHRDAREAWFREHPDHPQHPDRKGR